MPRKYVRHPKRVTRRGEEFTEHDFVNVAQSGVSVFQSAVSRVGNAMIGGDYTGNARGQNAIDIQITRGNPADATLIASGDNAILFGIDGKAAGTNSVAVGNQPAATGAAAVAVGRASIATGADSVALGTEAQALATAAVAVGSQVIAAGANSAAFGTTADAEGARSLALGYGATADNDDEVVIAGATIYIQISGTKKKIWHESNDGSGSGLDADYLDGHDTSYFATSGHTHGGGSYVSLSGDTMTGALMIDGSADVVQLRVQANGTQTENYQTWEKNGGTVFGAFRPTGGLYIRNEYVAPDPTYNATLYLQTEANGYQLICKNGSGDTAFSVTRDGNVTIFGSMTFSSSSASLLLGTVYLDTLRDNYMVTADVKLLANHSIIIPGSGSGDGSQVRLRIKGDASQTGNLQTWEDSSGNVHLAVSADGYNLVLDTSTGTKIGTSTSQKLGFWNTTPVVQPTTGIGAATLTGGGGANVTDTDTFDGYTLKQVVKALRTIGVLA